ncbi:amine sulfotransferase-like [Glandiceps talaboti]
MAGPHRMSAQSDAFYKVPGQFLCDGVLFPGSIIRKDLKDAVLNFECRHDDVFIVTYPRSGTTWTIELVSLIMNDADIERNESLAQYIRVPPIELFVKNVKQFKWFIIQFARLKSWLPITVQRFLKIDNVHELGILAAMDTVEYYDSMPFSSPRIIKTHMQHKFFPYQAFQKRSKDLRGTIKQLARFLEKDLSEEKIDSIQNYCSFQQMRSNPSVNMERELGIDLQRAEFIRKGIVGDWQNYFTVAQNAEFEEYYDEKMKNTGLTFEW